MYKKYDKIKNKGFDINDFKHTGLTVEEKLDGANASFTYDADAKKLRAFSRNQELSENNTLQGFYDYVQDMEFNETQLEMLSDYIIFGEWLVKHKINYKEEAYKKFYMFDVYFKKNETYASLYAKHYISRIFKDKIESVSWMSVDAEAFKSEKVSDIQDLIKQQIGKSELTKEPNTGEGIVVKSAFFREPEEESFKFVTDAFKESKGIKKDKPRQGDTHIVDYAITRPRLEKLIHKKIDEDVLTHEDLSLENFGKVMGAVAKDFQEDVLEEELDTMIKLIRQRIGKQLPNVLRPILQEKDDEKSGL